MTDSTSIEQVKAFLYSTLRNYVILIVVIVVLEMLRISK